MKGRLIDYLMVAPDAQIRIFDFRYQIMLFELFHRTRLTRTVHLVGTPLIVWALFLLAASLPLGGPALLLLLLAWYLKLDVLVGLAAAPLLAAMWLLAERVNAVAPDRADWWGLGIVVGGATLESLSHAVEPLPPPWSGGDGFLPGQAILAAVPLRVRLWGVLAGVTIFAALELMSSPRILSVHLARGLARLGHRRERYAAAAATARQILAGERVLSEQFAGFDLRRARPSGQAHEPPGRP